MIGTAKANANIALVKYWGKRDARNNLPLTDSLSVTLDGLFTSAKVHFDSTLQADALTINGEAIAAGELHRVSTWLERFRVAHELTEFARVDTETNIPVGAGLASSAAAFAAIAAATLRAVRADDALDKQEVSQWARLGSGSAARSVYGGLVHLKAGMQPHGGDCFALSVEPATGWDIQVVAAVVSTGKKPVGSTDAMNRTSETSPLYRAWPKTVADDIQTALDAIKQRDLVSLFALAEYNALAMHATAMAARPPIIYWHPRTVELLHQVQALREQGHLAYATMDAGPNVKVLTNSASVDAVVAAVEPYVEATYRCGVGEGLT